MMRAKEKGYLLAFTALAILGAMAHFFFGYSHWDLSGHSIGSDDAYISYRYALNFADGHGLVFNPGERVEGYTNLLYTLLASLFASIDPDLVYAACFAFNMCAYVATLLLFHWHLKQTAGTVRARLGTLVLCGAPLMWAWPASGLETSAVLFAQLGLFVCAEAVCRTGSPRLFIAYAALSAAAVLLRADGFIFAFLCSGIFILRRRHRHFVLAISLVGASTAALFAWRYAYYGDMFPNTYYAKVSGSLGQRLAAGVKQLHELVRKDAFLLYLAPVIPALWTLRKGCRGTAAGPLLSLMLVAYWLYIGGDVYYERFLLVIIPLCIIYLAGMVPARWLLPGAIGFLLLQLMPFKSDQRFNYHLEKYDRWVLLGRYLGAHHPGATLAIDAAGKVPYYSHLPTIDMLGLNDAHIGRKPASFLKVGHNKYDPDYVFARRPQLIAAWGAENLDLSWGLSKDRYLAEGYAVKYVVNATPASKVVNIIDVTGLSEERIQAFRRDGFSYFVLARPEGMASPVGPQR